MKDDKRERIDDAIRQQRQMEFWFTRRQPRYMDSYTVLWGEWFDDRAREKENEDD